MGLRFTAAQKEAKAVGGERCGMPMPSLPQFVCELVKGHRCNHGFDIKIEDTRAVATWQRAKGE